MTRRSRRASSAPQRVGSDQGLTSSRRRVEERAAADLTREPDDGSTADASEKVSGEAATSKRHTGKKKVDQTKDDTDVGWGERGDDDASARWLRENRPPHWD
ncbi:hypothetical protein V6K52_16215 [Knoellia sp. S7-12]|uniref:hypothetical protein n=1 Tax=Knoellia sp. S7-12 TaxID=3126698 RepID=UPI003365FEBF